MPQRNVMPVLPNQQNQRQQPQKKPPQTGGVNVKALVIIGIVVIGIIVLIAVKGGKPNKYESNTESLVTADSTPVETTPVETTPVVTEPPEPVEIDPSENAGTQITDLLAEGSVFHDANKYTLVTDIGYSNANSVADNTVISLDSNLTLYPSASCAYSYEFNTVNITHSSGSVLTLTRKAAYDKRYMPTVEEYTASLQTIAKSNGIVKPVYGEVYVGSNLCGTYVKGTLKANKEETDKTIVVMHFSGSPEIYSLAAIYSTQDEFDILLNSIRLYNTTLKLN